MTSIFTLGAAALLAYLTLGSSPDQPVAGRSKASASVATAEMTQTSATDPTHKMITVTAAPAEGTVPATPPTHPAPPTPPVPPMPPVAPIAPQQIKAVDPIVVTERDYPKLGLHAGFTGLTFFMGDSRKSCSKYTIPENGWGVTINRNTSPQESDVVLNPVLVTDSRGNRRLINFSDSEGSYMMRRSSDPHNESWEERINSTNGGTNVLIKGRRSTKDDDSLSMDDLRTLGEFGTPGLLDSVNAAMRAEINRISRGTRGLRKDSSIMPMMNMRIFVQDSERVKQLDNGDTNVFVKIVRAFKACDTVSNGGKEDHRFKFVIKHETNLSTDSLATTVPHLLNVLQIDNVGRSVEERLSARLNSLVPVLVRPSTTVTHNERENRDYDNGVVMWFAPTKALADALPAADRLRVHYDNAPAASVASNAASNGSGVISNAMLFPNPATTMTTVHFQLAEPRTVAFSIHDILGKKLIDGGQSAYSAGDQTRELDLDELSAGMYLLAMTTDRGEQVIQRIVVRK